MLSHQAPYEGPCRFEPHRRKPEARLPIRKPIHKEPADVTPEMLSQLSPEARRVYDYLMTRPGPMDAEDRLSAHKLCQEMSDPKRDDDAHLQDSRR